MGEETHLHKRPLDLTIRARPFREPPPANSVNLVHEDNARLVLARIPEHLAHHPRRLADVLVDDRGGDDFEELGVERRGDRAREEGLACPRWPVEQYALRRFDAHAQEELGVH